MANNERDLSNNSLDILKALCTISIVGIHVAPIVSNDVVNTLLIQLFFRLGVPLFFISSGFFFSKMDNGRRKSYLKRILAIYFAGSLLYLPFAVKLYLNGAVDTWWIVKIILLGYWHLWYLVALFVSLFLWYIAGKLRLKRFITEKGILIIAITLLLIGAFFDEYYHIIDNSIITSIGTLIDKFGTTRSAVFMGIPLVLIGRHLQLHQDLLKVGKMRLACIMLFSTIATFFELMLIVNHIPDNYSLSCDITFFNWIPAVAWFIFAMTNTPFKISKTDSRILRKLTDVVYVIHPFVIGILGILYNDCRYIFRYVAVLVISFTLAFLSIALARMIRPDKQKH